MNSFVRYSYSEAPEFSHYEDLVRRVYGSLPGFAETRIRNTKTLLSASNPLLVRARVVNIVALDSNGQPVGHATITIDPDAAAIFIGFCEFIDDTDLSSALLRNACDIAVAEGGMRPVVAPVDLSPWISFRACSFGDAPPFIGEPYTPTYYAALYACAGFEVVQWNETRVLSATDCGFGAYRKDHDGLLERGYTLVPFTEAIRMMPEQIHGVLSRAFAKAALFTPLRPEEFLYALSALFSGESKGSFVAIDPAGDCVGVLIAYLEDVSAGGRTVFKTIAVDPAHEGQGVAKALFFRSFREAGVEPSCIFATMRVDNDPIFGLTAGRAKAGLLRRYETYRKRT